MRRPARGRATIVSEVIHHRRLRFFESSFNRLIGVLVLLVCCATSRVRAIVIDGTAEPAYGDPFRGQQLRTNFGDNLNELDALYAKISGGQLYLVLAGNLEPNFNKLEIFIDSTAGGQNRLRGDNPDVDFNGLNRMGDNGSGNGLTFDAGFAADFYITATWDGGTVYANSAEILTGGGGTGLYLGSSPPSPGQIVGPNGVVLSLDNQNTAGVTEGTTWSWGGGVRTGIEVSIPLALIGPATDLIRITAFINAGGHNFASNQWLGSLPSPNTNLGDPRNINLNTIAGNQFVTVFEDADGDALPDVWEMNGVDINGDGTIDLDLPALGASPVHKDIFVEVDAMVAVVPAQGPFDDVIASFAAVPNDLLQNPDGNPGINLHVERDEMTLPDATWTAATGAWPPEFHPLKSARFGTAAQRSAPNAANILLAKAQVYRYCIFAKNYDSTKSSGLAELRGNDFMVTLGGWTFDARLGGSRPVESGTFMHELGHTLGLGHGGLDGINYKPNYYSVMSYSWQCPARGYRMHWILDYSKWLFPALDESHLDENAGINGIDGRVALAGPLSGSPLRGRLVWQTGAVDWNRNGADDQPDVAADINRTQSTDAASPGQMLRGQVDWSNLWYNFRETIGFANGNYDELLEQPEMTYEVHQELNQIPPIFPAGDLNCTSVVDAADVEHFVEALIDPAGYDASHPMCLHELADLNQDGAVDGRDVSAMVALLVM